MTKNFFRIKNFIRTNKSSLKLAIICAACVAVNVCGCVLVKVFHLSIYLDTIGTVFISALGGYVPGIAVGFLTNLVTSRFESEEIYYGIVNVSIAIITAFLYRRGYFEKFSKVLMIIPATVLLASFTGGMITELLSLSNSFDSLISLRKIFERVLEKFVLELPDKSLSILLTFVALKFIPQELKQRFGTFGKMQAPVSSEMRRAIDVKNNFVASLRTKMIFTLMSITILVAFFISLISYTTYRNNAINERERIADGIITMVVNEIDPKRVDDFIEHGHQAEGYYEVEHKLYKIRASNSDIKFIYVYKIEPDGCRVVFDLDTPAIPASEPGELQEFDESFYPLLSDLFAGRPIRPIISDDTYGYLLTIYKPVYDSTGHCVCYAGIDFSMDLVNDSGRTFITRVIALFSGVVIFIFALSMWFIENNIILPVNTMAYCAKNFAYNSEEAREKNIERMRELNIRTRDEIENLYEAFLKTTTDSMHYFDNLRKAKIQVAVMNQLAHTDSLTGIKNKTAYIEAVSVLDRVIAEGHAAFSVAMVDINFLKKVNDTYGHERGDEYLLNACRLICKVFGKENVYRIGGDEFVVVLDGENFPRSAELVNKFRDKIKKFQNNATLKPWQKVSAAVGLAQWQTGDESTEDVFKRADKQMYENKIAMKAQRKD